jgi:hypothetical protein
MMLGIICGEEPVAVVVTGLEVVAVKPGTPMQT